MKILYISALPGILSGGPRYSIPRQIESQAEYDDVHWVNLNGNDSEECKVERHNLEKGIRFRLENMPAPFDRPDLVVFEEVYKLEYCRIGAILRKKGIPYIIVPRSSLTGPAQKIKNAKKRLGNIILFGRFARKAAAIQYLTESEQDSSGNRWNRKSIIIPNGIDKKSRKKDWDANYSLKGVFIGRMNMFHKGLDILLDSCIRLKEELLESGCTIELYGPDRGGAKAIMAEQIAANGLEDVISINDGVYGAEKEDVLLASDFFILTSRFEGHPMGLLEALSYGLPCIVTKGSNMAGEIYEADAGWTAETNAASLEESLGILLKERERLPEKGRKALLLSGRYDWSQIARRAHDAYEQILQTETMQKGDGGL